MPQSLALRQGRDMFYGIDYTTTVNGSVIKFVHCEECEHEYVYEMARRISRSAFSVLGVHNQEAADRSHRHAETALEKSLRESCDPVPCPQCGHYQQAMVDRIRKTRLKWMKTAALYLMALAPMVVIFTLIGSERNRKHLVKGTQLAPSIAVIGGYLSLIPILLIGRRHLNRVHDPNSQNVHDRIALGRMRAVSKVQYMQTYPSRGQR
jgi:hypothetical protein